MFTHFGGGGAALPEIGHSLRFNSADSAYLSKTLPSASGAAKSALSLWVKRTSLGAYQSLFVLGGDANDANNYAELYFNATDSLVLYANIGGSALVTKVSSAVFRDVSAHYHVCCLVDTTLATAEDRFQLWVNGVRLTSFSTNTNTWTQNNAFYFGIGSPRPHWIGANYSTYFNGYISRVCFVYNATATPSDFAYTDPNGQWRSKSAGACKAVVDAGGTNSFMLDFNDGSSTTTLGNDYSAKGNNWTLINFTRSAGVNDDWMEDTPTNNFCTLNPLWSNLASNLADGALRHNGVPVSGGSPRAGGTVAVNSGKWYWEQVHFAGAAGTAYQGGVAKTSVAPANLAAGSAGTTMIYSLSTGSNSTSYDGSTIDKTLVGVFAANDVLQVAVDFDTGNIWYGKNGTWLKASGDSTPDPAAGLIPAATFTVGSDLWSPVVSFPDGWGGGHINFGQRAFAYTPPTGFKALCTKNLPVGSVTTSGSFTGNAAANGPFVWLNGTPTAMTINGNAVTFGTHADKLANGFKLRTSSASYNASGSNTYSVSTNAGVFKYNNAEGNP